jgi:hypothetical protein
MRCRSMQGAGCMFLMIYIKKSGKCFRISA